MGDDTENTQTQTQNSQVEWSQHNTPSCIPTIWGRLYSTNISSGKHCWMTQDKPEYIDIIQPEFSLGRTLTCTFVMKKHMIKENIIKNVSKKHFTIQRDQSEPQSPAILTDFSYNGTFVNGEKIGKGNSRVLDDNDEISVTHPFVKIFVFKDLLKNEQDQVPKEISEKYYISRILGQGACGIVKLVYNKTKCSKHAMKIIKKSRLSNGQFNHLTDPEKIMNEINIMKALRHPCIISTEEVYDSRDAVYIILELMQGGELFDRITKQGHLSEPMTRFFFRQMVLAVKYLHSQGITHRDLKPENVLLESKDEETLVKLTDFGLSKFVGEDSFMKTICGTPLYLAPEVIRSNGVRCYGPEVDVWSLGVIFFVWKENHTFIELSYVQETHESGSGDSTVNAAAAAGDDDVTGDSSMTAVSPIAVDPLGPPRLELIDDTPRISPNVHISPGDNEVSNGDELEDLHFDFQTNLVGYLPFSADYKDLSLTEQILCGRYRFSHDHWKGISLQGKILMKRMLTVHVDRRITLTQILNHSWMQDNDVIIRVEKLLTYKHDLMRATGTQTTISSTCNEDDNSNSSNTDSVTVIRLVATGKRTLSDSYSSCEPAPKRFRLGMVSGTNSTSSYCSEE